jgi:hypothetical protein
MPSLSELTRWFVEGEALGATHVLAVVDTFPHEPEEFPRFIIPGVDTDPPQSMEIQGLWYDLLKTPESYFRMPIPGPGGPGCTCRGGVCGCC